MVQTFQSENSVRFPWPGVIEHLYAIRALALREVKLQHMKTGGLGFWAEFIMPIFIMTMHYFVFIALQRRMPARMPCELFVLGGFTTWFTFRNAIAPAVRGGQETEGTLFIPGITPFHFMAASALWECAMMSFVLYAGLLFCELVFGNEPLPYLPTTMMVFGMAAVLGCGYGLVFDTLGWIWPIAKSIRKPLTWLLFLTSGIYSAQTNDQISAAISWFNPLIHLIGTQRCALWPGYPVSHVSLLYAAAWDVGLLLTGLLMHRFLRKYAK